MTLSYNSVPHQPNAFSLEGIAHNQRPLCYRGAFYLLQAPSSEISTEVIGQYRGCQTKIRLAIANEVRSSLITLKYRGGLYAYCQ